MVTISKPDEPDGGKGELQLGSPPQKNHNCSLDLGAGSQEVISLEVSEKSNESQAQIRAQLPNREERILVPNGSTVGTKDGEISLESRKENFKSHAQATETIKDCVKGTHENPARSGHPLILTTMKGNFVSGEVKDLISSSQDMDDEWDEDALIADWTKVEKKPKGKNKNKAKEGAKIFPKNNKKGSKPRGDLVLIRSEGIVVIPSSTILKNGDVGSSLSPIGRPSNQQKRTAEAIRSIVDGSQRTILEEKNFLNYEYYLMEY